MASGEDDEWLNFSLYRMAEMKMSVKKIDTRLNPILLGNSKGKIPCSD